MQYYLIALLISIFFAYMYKKDCKHRKIYFILSMLPFILISGFRYNVGTDYSYRYLSEFNEICQGGNPSNLEIGFKLIIHFILLFTNNSQYLFLLTSIIIIAIIYFYMFKYTQYPWISILIFFFGGFFFNSMNILRQYLAIAFLICAFHSLINDKKILWFLFIVLAMLQHTTAIIFLLSYIPYYFQYDLKKTAKILSAGLIIGIVGKSIFLWLVGLTRFKVYLTGSFASYVQGDFQVVQTLVNLIILFTYIYIYYKISKVQNNKYIKFCICMQMIACIFSIYTAFVFLSARFVTFFSIYSIYGIAKMYEYITDKNLLIKVTSLVIVIYVSSFCYLYLKNNVDEVLPYKYRLLEYQINIVKELSE